MKCAKSLRYTYAKKGESELASKNHGALSNPTVTTGSERKISH